MKPTRATKKKVIVFITAILFALFLGIWYFNQKPGQYDRFAQCLTKKGIKIYGAYWCPHCKNQKELFGRSWKYVNYVECSLPNSSGQREICNKAGIEGYPTWELSDGTRVSGEQSLKTLGKFSACPLVKDY